MHLKKLSRERSLCLMHSETHLAENCKILKKGPIRNQITEYASTLQLVPLGKSNAVKMSSTSNHRDQKTSTEWATAKKAARSEPSSRSSQNSKLVKFAKVPKTSRNRTQAPKPGSKPVQKESFWKRLAIDEISLQSPQQDEIAPTDAELSLQQTQDCPRSGDTGLALPDIEKDAYKAVEPLGLEVYGSTPRVGSRSETKSFAEDGPGLDTALTLEEYYLSGGKMAPPTLEEFVGPVRINRVGDGRGRGLILSCDVEAADLLLVSNPLAKVSKVETQVVESNFALEAGCWTGSHVLAEQLIGILSTQAWRSSRSRAMLSTLCCRGGEELPVPPMGLFSPNTSATTRWESEAICRTSTPFDHNEITRICGVVQCNAFGHTHITRKNEKDITRSWCCGLWMVPSFMNHSCVPNVASVVIGDAMIVIAARSLKRGDELTVAYFDIFRPLNERRLSMLRSWNFVCTCPRCLLEERMEGSLRLVAQAYGLRETEAALAVQALHMGRKAAWDKAWSPYSVIDLAQLAEYIEKVLYQEPGLGRDERNWIRASFLSAYLADGKRLMVDVRGLEEPRRRKHARKTHLQTALAAAKSVTPGHPQTLQIAAVVLKRAIHSYGKRSFLVQKARKRAISICMRLFGLHSEEALEKIVEAATNDLLSSSVVFLSRP